MDDVQPNERPLSRKGSTTVPRVRTARSLHRPPPQANTSKRWTKKHHQVNRDTINTRSHPTDNRRAPSTNARNLAQCHESGPSRLNLTPKTVAGLGGSSQSPSNQSSTTLACSSRRMVMQSSTTETNRQTMRTNAVRPVTYTGSPAEMIIDLTIDPAGTLVGENPVRWSTFRSGYMDVYFSPSGNDSRASPSEPNEDPWPSIPREPPQDIRQPESTPIVHSGNINPRLAQANSNTALTRSVEDSQIGGSISDLFRQHHTHDTAHSSYSSDRSVALTSSSAYNPPAHGSASTDSKLPLLLGSYDRPRRVLCDNASTYIVTAHGVVDQVSTAGVLKLDRNIRSPSSPFAESVDDACILSHQDELVVILGHAREQNQITILNLLRSRVSNTRLHRNWNTAKRAGVSAVAPLMSPLKFASGGYDHRVHLWDISQDLSGASATELAIKHVNVVHSLLPIVDTSQKLVSVGADRDVAIYDLSAERVVHTLKMSCIPFHAHKASSPHCTLVEVAHLEMQFEIHDHRLPHQVVQRFGFIAEERRGRFEKADSWSHFIACGDKNGAVHLWDLRNVSTEVALEQCFHDPIVQVLNTGPWLLACSKRNEIARIASPVG